MNTSTETGRGTPPTDPPTGAGMGDRPRSEKNRFLELVDELTVAKQRVDSANAQYRNVLSRAKNAGFNTTEMIRSLKEHITDPATREANKQAFLRYSKWLEEDR